MRSRRSLWSQRDFVALWSGAAVSQFGSQLSWLALPMVALGLVGVVFTLLTCAGIVAATATSTANQLLCPPGMLGRLSGTNRFLQTGLLPLGPLVAGGLGAWLGLRPALLIFAGLTLAAPPLLARSPVRVLALG